MKRFLLGALLAASVSFGVSAQSNFLRIGTTQAKVTMTGSFQQALALNRSRNGCTIQNNGATDPMYVYFDKTGGNSAPSDTTSSLVLTAGQAMNCNVGGNAVAIDKIWIKGTTSDVAVVTEQ